MNLRRRSLSLIQLALAAALAACASSSSGRATYALGPEALTNDSTIRAHCIAPEDVIAGRALCVLKDLPRMEIETH